MIDSVSVSHLTPTDATLEAQLNTEGLETSYQFRLEFGCLWPQACPEITVYPLPSGKLLSSFVDQSVSLDLNSARVTLAPGVEYAYSVTATNTAGSVTGHEQRFTTPEDGVQPLNTTPPPGSHSTAGPAQTAGQGTVTPATTRAVPGASKERRNQHIHYPYPTQGRRDPALGATQRAGRASRRTGGSKHEPRQGEASRAISKAARGTRRQRTVLDLLGWCEPDTQDPVPLNLDAHRTVVAKAMRTRLEVERDYMNETNVKGARRERETATRNARVIEEFLCIHHLTGRSVSDT